MPPTDGGGCGKPGNVHRSVIITKSVPTGHEVDSTLLNVRTAMFVTFPFRGIELYNLEDGVASGSGEAPKNFGRELWMPGQDRH